MASCMLVLRKEIPGDLHEIVDYLEQSSFELADRFSKAVRQAMLQAARHPMRGNPKVFKSPRLTNIRSWPVVGFENYLILYAVKPDRIRVLAVTHGARDLPRLLKRRV